MMNNRKLLLKAQGGSRLLYYPGTDNIRKRISKSKIGDETLKNVTKYDRDGNRSTKKKVFKAKWIDDQGNKQRIREVTRETFNQDGSIDKTVRGKSSETGKIKSETRIESPYNDEIGIAKRTLRLYESGRHRDYTDGMPQSYIDKKIKELKAIINGSK